MSYITNKKSQPVESHSGEVVARRRVGGKVLVVSVVVRVVAASVIIIVVVIGAVVAVVGKIPDPSSTEFMASRSILL
jgi:hypothetical protein